MSHASYDLLYIQAGIPQLESYLLSNDIYRPVGIHAARGESPYPPLTLGWLLLANKKAQAKAQLSSEVTELERLSERLQAIRARWRTAWGNKAQAEFRARLNLWRDFLEEYRENPQANCDRYTYEVNRRVLLELLAPETNSLPEADLQALHGLDQWLRSIFTPGNFVWETILAVSFPASNFWYLYGTIQTQIRSS